MSKEVEQKVVEMRFDNKQFESNVKTSMSTIDKLKQKLNFDGASKGLEKIDETSRKVNMSGLSGAVETVRSRFSALEVVGITALANITNSAINAGKQLVSSLTVQPVSDGFREYELKMGSIQTIMASTGADLKTVNKYLEELNEYSDKTIYSFSDMTNNIGKFTNAGVKLEDAVAAIKGVSNEAAVSGANAEEASRAMYNFAQALSAGYVKLIDWKSIENANMATVEFKNQLLETALALGTVVKVGDRYQSTTKDAKGSVSDLFDATHNFNDALSAQWMTTDVLTKTLGRYADETTDIGKKAFASAQDVKTFSMMMDTLKESVGSGWAQTFELIFGNFEEAKQLWTGLTNFFSGIIEKITDARNKVLSSALGKSFTALGEKIKFIKKPIDKTVETVKKAGTAVKDFSDIVNKVILGNFGNGKARFDALTKAGINYYEVQNRVNEKLGCQKRYSDELIESQNKLLGITKETIETSEQATEAKSNMSLADAKRIVMLGAMSDAELKANGLTNEQIKSLRELTSVSEKLGIPMTELIQNIDQINGRWLLMDSFRKIGESLAKVFGSIGQAWSETFNADKGEILFNLIAAFHRFANSLEVNDDKADNIRRTFKGLFTIIKMITDLVGGAFKLVIKIVSKVLENFGLDIWDVTAKIGDAIVAFYKWVERNGWIQKGIEAIANWITIGIKKMKEWIAIFKESELCQTIVENLKKAFDKTAEAGGNIIDGLKNGIKGGSKGLWEFVKTVAGKILEIVKKVLGIHSPSKEMYDVGDNFIQGFVNGVKAFGPKALDTVKKVFTGVIDFIKNIDWGNIIAIGFATGIVFMANKVLNIVDKFASVFEGLGKMFSGIGSMFSGVGKYLKAKALTEKSKAILNFAKAIALLAASLFLLSKIKSAKLWESVGAIAALAAVMMGMMAALSALGKAGKIGDVKVPIGQILALTVAMLLIATAMKKLSGIESNKVLPTIGLFATLIAGLVGVLLAMNGLAKKCDEKALNALGNILLKISAAFLILAIIAKTLAGMTWGEMGKAAAGIGGMVAIVSILIVVTTLAKDRIEDVGNTMLKISAAILILTVIAKRLAKMSWGEMGKAAIGLLGFVGIITLLIAATNLANGKEAKISGMLLAMSACMLILTITAKMISSMSWGAFIKAGVGLAGLVVIIKMMIQAVNLANGKEAKIALTLLAISFSMAILAAIAVVLGMISLANLAKGIVAVGLLTNMMGVLIKATKDAGDCKGTIVGLAVVIGVLAASLAVLSFLNPGKLLLSVVALGVVMGTLILMMKQTKGIESAQKSIIAMSVMLAILSGTLITLSCLDTVGMLAAALGLSATMLALAGAMKLMSTVKLDIKNIVLAAGFILAIGLALKMLAPALKQLGELSLGEIGKGLLALAGVFAVIGLAAVILGTVSPFIILLSVAILALGVAMLSAGVGIMSFASGLLLLSTISPAALVNVVNVITTILELIPFFLQKIGEGIVAICKVFIDNFPVFVQVVVTIITGICDAIIQTVPKITEAIIVIVTCVCQALMTCVPMIVQTGFALFIAFLKSISDNIGRIVELGMQIIINFINGIAKKLPALIQAAFNLVISFINGIADAIRKNHNRIYEAAWNLITALVDAIIDIPKFLGEKFIKVGKNIIDGIGNGIKKAIGKVKDIAKDIGNSLLNGVKGILGIHSPSKAFEEVGVFADKGLINGLKKFAGKVSNAGKEVGSTALDAVNKSISKISDAVNTNLDSQPTIRPILDLSSVTAGARSIDSLFSNRQAVAICAEGVSGSTASPSGATINMTVYGAQGQDVNQLAEIVSSKINNLIKKGANTWR